MTACIQSCPGNSSKLQPHNLMPRRPCCISSQRMFKKYPNPNLLAASTISAQREVEIKWSPQSVSACKDHSHLKSFRNSCRLIIQFHALFLLSCPDPSIPELPTRVTWQTDNQRYSYIMLEIFSLFTHPIVLYKLAIPELVDHTATDATGTHNSDEPLGYANKDPTIHSFDTAQSCPV